MKTFRMLTALAVVALLLALVPASMAQDQTFGLSTEDMAVLNSASAATAAATSGQFNFTLRLAITAEDESGIIDMTGTGTFDQDAAGEPVFQLSLSGNADMGDDGQMPLTAEVRVVNGSLYFMAPALLGPQWLELSADELGAMTADMGIDPAEIASGDLSNLEGMDDMSGMMAALANMDAEEFVSMTRSGDQFTTTVDLAGMFASEGFRDFLRSAAEADDDMDAADVNEMLTQLPKALKDSTMTLDQYVTDGMLSRIVLQAALNVDPSAIGEEGDAGNVALMLDLNLSNFNQSYPVEVPTNSVKLSEMLGAGMSGS